MKRICRLIGIFACMGMLMCGGCKGPSAVPTPKEADSGIPLVPQQEVHGIPGTPAAEYWFAAKSGEFFKLSVEKSANGLEFSVFRPDGDILRSVPCSHDGPLEISEIAPVTGRYNVRPKSCLSTETPSFGMTVSSAELAAGMQPVHVEAERLVSEAERLTREYRAASRQTAVLKYQEALKQWTLLKDHAGEANVFLQIGKLYGNAGDFTQAGLFLENALTLHRSVNDALGEADDLVELATVLWEKGDIPKALSVCDEALKIARAHSSTRVEEHALQVLGRIRYETGNYAEATAALEDAKRTAEARSDRLASALAVLYLGAVDFDLRRFDLARDKTLQALEVFRRYGEKESEARALTFLGHYYSALNQKQEALNLYQQAREIVTPAADFATEVPLLNGIARVHFQLGDTAVASQFFQLALERNRSLGNAIDIAYALRSLGECYFADGDTANALLALREALPTFRSISHNVMQAVLLQDIGAVLLAVGDRNGASESLAESLQISRSIGNRQTQARTLTTLGQLHESGGQFGLALKDYEEAFHLYDVIEHRLGKLTALYRIANCLRLTGKLNEALARSEAAIADVEKLRTSVIDQDLRTSYFASARQQYELFIDIQMRLYRKNQQRSVAIKAFETSERARARTLLETIAQTRVSISVGVDPKLVERDNTLRSLLDSRIEYYSQLVSSNADRGTISKVSAEISRLKAESSEAEGRLRSQSPQYAALIQPEPLKLPQIQKDLLDKGSILLEFAIGEENSYLWAITTEGFAAFVLPNGAQIEKKARQVRELMMARMPVSGEKPGSLQSRVRTAEAEYPRAAAELSEMLLGPAAHLLGKRRLIVVAEGMLQYFPFGALPAPRDSRFTPLIVDHEIVNLPSASTLAIIRREAPLRGKPDRTIAVFADPVFEKQDSRIASSAKPLATLVATKRSVVEKSDESGTPTSLPRLTFTRQEAETILSMVPANSRFAALGFDATKAAAMNPSLNRYRIVHFATHAILNDDHPDLSSLVLSLVDEKGNPQSGYLRLRDMYNLHLAAELVVLSACDTALGKEVKGEGLMSMVRGFMYSGTPRVLASLWKVDDEATAELMKEFYKNLLQLGQTPAAALRQAQITQMQKKSRQSPYYWAGFQLQGEWN